MKTEVILRIENGGSSIDGVGPVAADVAEEFGRNARSFKEFVVKSAHTDVVTVRTIPKPIRQAVTAKYPTCAIGGCDAGTGLEFDHVVPFALVKRHDEANIVRLCRHHHALKIYRGFELIRSRDGSWEIVRRAREGPPGAA